MLDSADLDRFLAMYEAVTSSAIHGPWRPAATALAATKSSLAAPEVRHLVKATRIAACMGQTPRDAALVLERIARDLKSGQVAPLTSSGPWSEAIAWGLGDLISTPPYAGNLWPREAAVADACLRLRAHGYQVDVDAFGSHIADRSRAEISRRVDRLVATVGGRSVLTQLFRILQETGRYHDGHWLFGNFVAGPGQTKSPAIPFGWLISLGLKHAGRVHHPNNPAKAWKNLVQLASDLCACFDVERYGQFEGIELKPADLPLVFTESVGWNQLFTQPQSLPELMESIRRGLGRLLEPEDRKALGTDFHGLLAELALLVASSAHDRLVLIRREDAANQFSQLVATKSPTQANTEFIDPFAAEKLDHFQTVLFDAGPKDYLMLPRSLVAAAAATLVVHRLWARLPKKRAEKVVGDLFETILADACHGKAQHVWSDLKYQFAGKDLQIDVAAREGQSITLFEVKSKSLTMQARSGNIVKTLDDYAGSFLALLQQLVRHERALRDGVSPLAPQASENAVEITCIAASPLTFGPISDRVLARALLRALVATKFSPADGDKKAAATLTKFGERFSSFLDEARPTLLNAKGEIDFHLLLQRYFWMDLGEILYLFKRSYTFSGAFQPLRHLTFVTRDFWTEVALADRGGLTTQHWRRVAS